MRAVAGCLRRRGFGLWVGRVPSNRLNQLASDVLRVLHDRRIPGSRANIDHVAVTPTGVYLIDAKKYGGRPT